MRRYAICRFAARAALRDDVLRYAMIRYDDAAACLMLMRRVTLAFRHAFSRHYYAAALIRHAAYRRSLAPARLLPLR